MSIFGIFQGIENIKNDFNSFFVGTPFPFLKSNQNLDRALTDIDQELWNENPGYAMTVVNSNDITTPIRNFGEFKFQINPQSLRQDEDFSIVPRATQTGVVVEHEGFVFKRLSISGTTGLQPKRGISGVSETGQVILGSGHSGYVEFGVLINYIRGYAEYKSNPDNAKARLIFKNFKDNEYWFVEPLRFSKSRDSSRPFESRYDIQFLIIGKADRVPGVIESFFQTIRDGIDFFILGPLNEAQQIMQDGVNFVLQVEREAESVIFQPLQESIDTINAIKTGAQIVSNLPAKFFKDFRDQISKTSDSLADIFGYGNTDYDTFFGRQGTVKNPAPTRPEISHIVLMEAFLKTEQALNSVLSTSDFFEEATTNQNKNFEAYFNNAVSMPEPSSVQESTILRGDTLERIASRTLGTSDRMLELVTLNNLEAPYIDPTGMTTNQRIKKYGDTILIPVFAAPLKTGDSKIDSKDIPLTRGLTAIEKFMGVDLKLSQDNDLVLTNANDFKLVAGIQNAQQGILIKFNLEKGSLITNPDLGVGVGIGEKANLSLSEIIQDLKHSVLQDPRYSDLTTTGSNRNGSVINLNLNVTLAKINQPLPVRVALT